MERRAGWVVAVSLVCASVVAVSPTVAGQPAAGPAANQDHSGLADELERAAEVLNFYREGTGLPAVGTDLGLSVGARAHSCWMALNDRLDHYTGGASTGSAGAMSNIAVARSQRYSDAEFVELWLTGPYHAISMLRWGLHTIGYGTCNDRSGAWRRAATMDVVTGYERRRTEAPVLFPPPDRTTDLYRFLTEEPNPLENCGWDTAGLPVFAMMPEPPTDAATGTLSGPEGPVEVCIVTARNDVTDGRPVLRFDNAVLVIPAEPLVEGRWDAWIDSGRRQVDWTFHVGERRIDGPPPPPRPVSRSMPATAPVGAPGLLVTTEVTRTLDTRVSLQPPQLPADVEFRVPVGTPPVPAGATGPATAVAITLTSAGHGEPGWAAVYPCAGGYQGTSTVNFVPGVTAANSAIVPLMGAGADGSTADLCGRVSTATDLIVDVSGWLVPGAGAGFATDEKRLLDTRGRGPDDRIEAGTTLTVHAAPPGSVAVALNLTTPFTDTDGYLTVWPCDRPRRETSVSQATVGMVRATSAIVPVAADGTVCVYTSARTHLIVDRQGVFTEHGGGAFVPLLPVRAIDTRNGPHPWSDVAQRVTGRGDVERAVEWALPGLPTGTTGLVMNVTSVGGARDGWLATSGCGTYAGQSSLNFTVRTAMPNQVIVDAAGGRSCLRVEGFTHLIADITGAFVE